MTPSASPPGIADAAAPFSAGTEGPGFPVPAQACDCHMHLFDNALPFAGEGVLKHGDATPQDYRALQRRLHLQRNVLVQPSSYGRDHRVLLAGLRALGPSARGVAVIDPSATRAELEELHAAGVVGVRFNLVQAGATHESMLEDVARLVQPFGWHIQVHAHPQDLLRLSQRLVALPVPVVIDHYARFHVEPEHAGAIAARMSWLLGSRRVWLKLSAPYIADPRSSTHEGLGDWVRQLAHRHLDRLVWGSDWPHVTEPSDAKPDDAVLMDLLASWLSEDEIQRVLVDNPARLYGFEPDSGTTPR